MEQPVVSEGPVKLEIAYPETSSRGLALCALLGIKAIMLIPVIIVFYVFQIVASVAMIVALFVVLFTGKYPRGIFDLLVRVFRWAMQINTYYMSMSDKYPPWTPP